jgi:hypothetical protein
LFGFISGSADFSFVVFPVSAQAPLPDLNSGSSALGFTCVVRLLHRELVGLEAKRRRRRELIWLVLFVFSTASWFPL